MDHDNTLQLMVDGSRSKQSTKTIQKNIYGLYTIDQDQFIAMRVTANFHFFSIQP